MNIEQHPLSWADATPKVVKNRFHRELTKSQFQSKWSRSSSSLLRRTHTCGCNTMVETYGYGLEYSLSYKTYKGKTFNLIKRKRQGLPEGKEGCKEFEMIKWASKKGISILKALGALRRNHSPWFFHWWLQSKGF